MFIKKKSILVIILSTTLISLVFVITLFGFYLYLNWKAENNKLSYRTTLSELNARLYEKYVSVASVLLKIDSEGIFKGNPVVEGHITNRSSKKITSLKLRVSILDNENRVLYRESFYPLRREPYLSVISKGTGNYLAPDDSISFKHLLKNCPKDVLTYLKMKTRFAKEKKSQSLNLDYKLEELIVE